jgi:O-phosphoseryl-tRNA(Sec) selenium transferase
MCIVLLLRCLNVQVKAVARLCSAFEVPHVINNAYGVQSQKLCKQVTAACLAGRVDVVIQSTDKNFMVPVGGAVVAATASWPEVMCRMTEGYPGRASVCTHLDMATTLLYLGRSGWRKVLEGREALFPQLQVGIPPMCQESVLNACQAKPNTVASAYGTRCGWRYQMLWPL